MKKIFMLLIFVAMLILNPFQTRSAYAEGVQDLYIKAVNPGYSVDGKQNVGEFIEISRRNYNSDVQNTPILLAGLIISYTNSSGNSINLLEFPENSWLTGENLLLRLASSSMVEQSNLQYPKTLAMKAGPLLLIGLNGEVLDSVCWSGEKGCSQEFNNKSPTTLVRDDETNDFVHLEMYEPNFSEDNYYEEKKNEEEIPAQCSAIRFSEILSYYEDEQSEQFIELYNSSTEQILITGCSIKYKNKYYELSGIIKAEDYYVRSLHDFSLTKNPTTQNTIELIDKNGNTIDELIIPNGQKKAASYALIGVNGDGNEVWKTTYAQTPGEANEYQEYKTCPSDKTINKKTGNCVKIVEEIEKTCPDGKYLNPLTGRCKSYDVEEEKICAEGYELNPDTNRCRKIKENDGAEYELEDREYTEKTSFIAIYALILIIIIGFIYIIYQFRQEIKRLFCKVHQLIQKTLRRGPDRH